MIPASNCSNFDLKFNTTMTEIFKNDINLYSNIAFAFESLLVAKVKEEIKYKKFRSHLFFVNLESFSRLIPTKYQITNCCWKPKVVWSIDEFNKDLVDSTIKSSYISSGENEFNFE